MTMTTTILLVDDDRNLQKTLAAILQKEGYALLTAASGQQALELLSSHDVPLVLMDLKLGDMDGLELLSAIRESSPQSECIILTGFASQDTAIEAINLGVFAYFLKPYEINQLLHSIRQALEKHHTRQQLAESEQKYKHLIEHATLAIFRTKLDGSAFLEANQAMCNLFEYSRAELMALPPVKIWADPADRKRMLAKLRKVGFIEKLEVLVITRSGKVLQVMASYRSYPSEGYLEGSAVDITELKRLERTLQESESRIRRKLDAILQPEGDASVLELADIVDVPALQALMDHFYQLTNIGVGIFDLKGNVLVNTGWQDICHKFHRTHPETLMHCLECDLELSSGIAQGQYKLYRCKNNMFDMATPVMLDDVHVGNIFFGQFFIEGQPPEKEIFRQQARQYGFDEAAYLEAFDRVPYFTQESVDHAMHFYALLAEMLSKTGYSNIQLSQSIAQHDALLETLKASEEKFSLAFRTSPYAITIAFLEDGRLVDVNQGFSDITGYGADEALGKTSLELDLWANPEQRQKIVKGMLKGENISGVEAQFRKKNGELMTGLFSGQILLLNDQKFILSSINDITALKTAQSIRVEAEARFKWLYVNAPIPYHILNAKGIIVDVNQRWCDVLGYSHDEVIGKHIFDFIAAEERAAAKKSFQQKMASHDHYQQGHERKYITSDGRARIFKTYDFFDMDEGGRILAVQTTIEDITAQKAAESELLLNLKRLRSLVEIMQYEARNEQDFLDFALDEAIKLTHSEIGHIHFYDESTQLLTLNTWSKDVMKACSVQDPQSVYQLEKTGIWGEAMRQRKTIMVNDFHAPDPLKKGFPEGHAPLKNFLTIPVFNEQRIVAVVGMANKTSDYNEADALQLTLLMDSVWK